MMEDLLYTIMRLIKDLPYVLTMVCCGVAIVYGAKVLRLHRLLDQFPMTPYTRSLLLWIGLTILFGYIEPGSIPVFLLITFCGPFQDWRRYRKDLRFIERHTRHRNWKGMRRPKRARRIRPEDGFR